MILSAILLVFPTMLAYSAAAPVPDVPTREKIAATFKEAFAAMDADADGLVSSTEFDGAFRVEMARSSDRSLTANAGLLLEAMRQQFKRQDRDTDGRLSLAEYLSEPLSFFDCLDQNRDGIISQKEETAGLPACEAKMQSVR